MKNSIDLASLKNNLIKRNMKCIAKKNLKKIHITCIYKILQEKNKLKKMNKLKRKNKKKFMMNLINMRKIEFKLKILTYQTIGD